MTKTKLLAVDDEAFNLEIITKHLEREGYEVVQAQDGIEALALLEKHPETSTIVLDQMMPRMNGMEFLNHVKRDPRFTEIPVVLQTAVIDDEQVSNGIKNGAYYYLTKPYQSKLLINIVNASVRDYRTKMEIREEMRRQKHTLCLMQRTSFRFQTIDESRNLAYLLANCFPDPDKAIYGLNELMLNAIEHGNLGITYQRKAELLRSGRWEEEISQLLAIPENLKKFAEANYEVNKNCVTVTIIDQGKGFNWKEYLEFSPARAFDVNGRGIALARTSFNSVDYKGSGNTVVCKQTSGPFSLV